LHRALLVDHDAQQDNAGDSLRLHLRRVLRRGRAQRHRLHVEVRMDLRSESAAGEAESEQAKQQTKRTFHDRDFNGTPFRSLDDFVQQHWWKFAMAAECGRPAAAMPAEGSALS